MLQLVNVGHKALRDYATIATRGLMDEIFNVTKMVHNGLQGAPETLSAEDREIYVRYQELNAREFEDDADFVIIHDPQPIGVIDAYREVKRSAPDVQLALVGSMAHDDPEGWDFYHRTVAYADGDPDIYILSNLNNVGSVEVNAFQVHSSAVIQKSVREGFGLTVSEALWKARPTVAGRAGGIVDQITD